MSSTKYGMGYLNAQCSTLNAQFSHQGDRSHDDTTPRRLLVGLHLSIMVHVEAQAGFVPGNCASLGLLPDLLTNGGQPLSLFEIVVVTNEGVETAAQVETVEVE